MFTKKEKEQYVYYNTGKIFFAHTVDGAYCEPFVFNLDGTKIKDIKTERIVPLRGSAKNKNRTTNAIKELFCIPPFYNVKVLSLIDMFVEYADGTVNDVKGKAFAETRDHIRGNNGQFLFPEVDYKITLTNHHVSYPDLLPQIQHFKGKLKSKYDEIQVGTMLSLGYVRDPDMKELMQKRHNEAIKMKSELEQAKAEYLRSQSDNYNF